MASGLKKATNAKLPFGLGSVKLTDPSSAWKVLAIVFGFMVYAVANTIGSNLGNYLLSWMAPYLPSQAGGTDGQGMVRGEL